MPIVDGITPALNIKWDKRHELGWQLIEVDGKRSKYYHFVIKDKKSGRKYMPYVEVDGEDGERKKIYLDFRNMLFDPEFMRDKAIEIFFVYDHRDLDNTIKTRYDGVHASFQLDEFTEADVNMSDFAKMMRRHYMGDMREDYRFLFLQLRAKAIADAARKPARIPSVFSFDGFAFSFSVPEGKFRAEAPSNAPESAIAGPNIGNQEWFGAGIGCHVVDDVAALIAQMPVLAENVRTDACGNSRQDAIAGIAAAASGYQSSRMKQAGASQETGRIRVQEGKNRMPGNKNFEYASHGSRKNSRGMRKKNFKPVPLSALSSFKAVIFDLDGVIVDSEMVHPRTFERALAKYGVKINNAHWKRAYTGIGSPAIFKDLIRRYGIKEDARTLVKRRNAIYLAEIRKNKLPIIKGFAEVHHLLVENGIKEAVASGGHANHVEESLRSAGLKGVPFVAIEHVKNGKPSPEIFLRAAKKIRVKPSECIVFEDSLSGVEAAAAAGMPCVALTTTMRARELTGRAALVVRNFRSRKLKKLLAVLLEWREKGAQAKAKRARAAGKGKSWLRAPRKRGRK